MTKRLAALVLASLAVAGTTLPSAQANDLIVDDLVVMPLTDQELIVDDIVIMPKAAGDLIVDDIVISPKAQPDLIVDDLVIMPFERGPEAKRGVGRR